MSTRVGPGGARAHVRLRRSCGHLSPALALVHTAGPKDELVPLARAIELTDADMKALRRRYDEERDKRLNAHPEGLGQYERLVDMAGSDERFAKVLKDPYPQVETPHPLTDEVEVCIVGAGYGGLCTGARLVREGVDPATIRIIDKAGDVGGTWYWNRYPGAMCDTEAYIYMPMCEELGYVPTAKYASQPELLAHSQLMARTYGLYENASFGAEVTGLSWDEGEGKWTVTTDRGDNFRARSVVINMGTFTFPKVPRIPGFADFQGRILHTSRWDYTYTGGSTSGELSGLGDKRVAIIGTGATAVQAVPHLANASEHLYVFQRTPSAVGVRNNRPTTEEFAREFLSKPGWQQERNGNFYDCVQSIKGPAGGVDLVQDGWTDLIGTMLSNAKTLMEDMKDPNADANKLVKDAQKIQAKSQFQQTEHIRRRVGIVVEDQRTAEGLKPWYDPFCKRPCFHDGYLDAFNRPNVTLVHTDGVGIDRFTQNGVVVAGVEFPVDAIVMATGFETGSQAAGAPLKLPYDIVGREGRTLHEKWIADHKYGIGPKTYRSHCSSGFPNLFFLNGPQGTFTVNFVYTLDESARHIAHIISSTRAMGKTRCDVKQTSEDAWVDQMWAASPPSSGKVAPCTPGYYNAEGRVDPKGTRRLAAMVPGNARKFFKTLARERDEGTALDAFELL